MTRVPIRGGAQDPRDGPPPLLSCALEAGVQRSIDPWTAFGMGVAAGVVGGLVLISLGAILLAVVVVVFAIGFKTRPPFGGAGILAGWGGAWLVILAAADSECGPPFCVAPGLMPIAMISLGLVAAAVLLLLLGIRRPRPVMKALDRLRRFLRGSPARETFATVLGAFTGLAIAVFWTGGWAIGALVVMMFVSSRRAPDRRIEIAWFVLGAVAASAVILTR